MVYSRIDTFNQYFRLNVDGMNERGESKDNLMTKIFKDYQVA